MATRTTTRTQTRATSTFVGKPGSEPLTRDEELVVRMSRGLGEGGSFALPMRSGGRGDLRARLALIEAGLLAEVHGAGPLAEQLGVQVDADMKAKILARLSQLDD